MQGGIASHVERIYIQPSDTPQILREQLRRLSKTQVLFILPWEAQRGWRRLLDFEVLRREALRQELAVAWVVEDPARRTLPREAGFTIFTSEAEAEAHLTQAGTFPPPRQPELPPAVRRPWWAEPPRPRTRPTLHPRPVWLLILELGVLLAVLLTVAGVAFLVGPSARIVLVPEGLTYTLVIPVSVDLQVDEVDLQQGLIPSRKVGVEAEAYAEVPATGVGITIAGKAKGTVIFTNLLGQDYPAPAGTIVRTTAGSYPVRFVTTQPVNVPAFGQAPAPIEALEEGPGSNVSAYQINQVESVAGLALRVTNPEPTSGAESSLVPAVTEADQSAAWALAKQQVLAQAYNQMLELLQPGEFLPRQALRIEAVPKEAYTHLVGEQSPKLGLTLRLLVSGQAVSVADAQAVAYQGLATHLPEGYSLTDARFEYGEVAEEDVGPGYFTFYVTAHGYASAKINTTRVWTLVKGQSIAAGSEALMTALPLAQPPEVTITPPWFPFFPRVPLRTEIKIVPGKW